MISWWPIMWLGGVVVAFYTTECFHLHCSWKQETGLYFYILSWIPVRVPDNCAIKTYSIYSIWEQISCWQFHCTNIDSSNCITNSFWSSLTPSFLSPSPRAPASLYSSLNRAVVFWGSLLVCFLLFGFSLRRWFFPQLSPSIFISIRLFFFFLFPLALTGVPSLQGLADGYFPLHCSVRPAHGLDVCVCLIGRGFDFFFFFFSVGRENMTNPTLFPALFLMFSCK